MKLYLSADQKSSELLPADYRIGFGLSLSAAVAAIKQGRTAHIRIYDLMLRLSWAGLIITVVELIKELADIGILLSPAQAHRILTDERLFTFAGTIKTGKRGRETKTYIMQPALKVCQDLGVGIGAVNFAPMLMPVDHASVKNYENAIMGRVLDKDRHCTNSRQTQMKFWQVSKPTIIRKTREISEVIERIKYRRSDSYEFTLYPDPQTRKDVFLWKVGDAERTKSRKYWLEIVNSAGEIRKLPCTQDNASRWLNKGVVTLCEQQTNFYSVDRLYLDPSMDLPF